MATKKKEKEKNGKSPWREITKKETKEFGKAGWKETKGWFGSLVDVTGTLMNFKSPKKRG